MKSEEISAFLRQRIEEKDFPSAVYLIAEKGEIVFQDALGLAVIEPERIEAQIDTIYDLASLTKPLVTGLLCARLIEQKRINLNEKIAYYLPDFERIGRFTDDKRKIKIIELLAHGSAFPAWNAFYLLCAKRSCVLDKIIETSRNFEQPPITYSDLNFMTLTFLLEKLYGQTIDHIARTEIFEALDLENTFFNPPSSLKKRIAASEKGNEFEREICREKGYDSSAFNWREYQVWGEVHDGNCWFMNGVSGHAGLFSNAFEIFKIAEQFLPNYTRVLEPETCSLFCWNFTKGLNEARSIAFQLAETKDSTAGKFLAKNSFGHLGFTGTSLWIDPEKERIFILLTNRTHARPLPFANINAARREFHNLAAELLNARK